MMTGRILVRDGVVRFIAHPRKIMIGILKDVGLTLFGGRHMYTKSTSSFDRIKEMGKIDKDYNYFIDMLLFTNYVELPVDSSLGLDLDEHQVEIAGVPLELFGPYYKDPSRLLDVEYELFVGQLSQKLLSDFHSWSIENPIRHEKVGTFKAFSILSYIYKSRIFARYETSFSWGLTNDEIITYRRAGLETS